MWSTRQLADLAGVSLRAIRHWHEIGLLPEPERLSNGYKQYDARHLVLALRIARLASLGFSLNHIAEMLKSDTHSDESLRGVRAELDRRIADLRRIRKDIDDLIAKGVSPDLSPEAQLALEAFGPGANARNVSILLARLISKEQLSDFAATLRTPSESMERFNRQLLDLAPDASESVISELSQRGVEVMGEFLAEYGEAIPQFDSSVGEENSAEAVRTVMEDSMNSAQQQVLEQVLDRLEDS